MFHVELQRCQSCPVCGNHDLQDHLSVRDHFLTGQLFQVQRCLSCGLLLTNPRPIDEQLHLYYQSDNYLSHTSSKGLMATAYGLVKRINLKRKLTLINQLGAQNVLDFGAGEGSFVAYCKKRGLSIEGYEPNTTARQNAQLKKVLLHSSLPLKNRYDIITMWHVLEHVSSLEETLSQLRSTLNPNGYMVIAVPNINSHDAEVYKEFWAAYDVPRHLWHFTEETIISLLESYEMTFVKSIPMFFDAYYISLVSARYKKASKTKALITAFISNCKARMNNQGASSQIYVFRAP